MLYAVTVMNHFLYFAIRIIPNPKGLYPEKGLWVGLYPGGFKSGMDFLLEPK